MTLEFLSKVKWILVCFPGSEIIVIAILIIFVFCGFGSQRILMGHPVNEKRDKTIGNTVVGRRFITRAIASLPRIYGHEFRNETGYGAFKYSCISAYHILGYNLSFVILHHDCETKI